jgi:putative Holliday junction resolvase
MRVLGVDLGKARIGLAVGESEAGIASPRAALSAIGTLEKDAQAVAAFARRERAEAIVVGVPESEDGRMAAVCRRFGTLLRSMGFVVYEVDESLTSVEAESAMAEAGLKASERRKKRDGEAACRILLRWMEGDGASA